MKNIFFIGAIFVGCLSTADTQITAEMTGSVDLKIKDEEHFRHSLDCYVERRGNELRDLPDQKLSLEGGLRAGGPGVYSWNSNLQSPFARTIRTTNLNWTQSSSGFAQSHQISLSDNYGYEKSQYTSTKCGHHDGITRPEQARIAGKIKLRYTVPDGVWVLRVERSGSGVLNAKNFKPLSGALNDGYDRGVFGEEIVWVKPGSEITQEIEFPDIVTGNPSLGSARINFIALGQPVQNVDEMSALIKKLGEISKTMISRFDHQQPMLDFIERAATLLHNPVSFRSAIQRMTTKEVAIFSKILFQLANQVYASPNYALPLKTIAALTSYEVAIELLQEMQPYCRQAEIYLPLTDKKIQVLGLRVAGFWLSRGLLRVKHYGFEQYDALLSQLLLLEATGTSYSAVMQDDQLREKLRQSYDFLVDALDLGASPFRASLKDVQRTLQQFGTIGSGNSETSELVHQLRVLDDQEFAFTQHFSSRLSQFSEQNLSRVQISDLKLELESLRQGQLKISSSMERNIRLLSVDRADENASVMNTMLDLMTNQISIFESKLDKVPYFENLRQAYLSMNDHSETLKQIRSCLTGGQP